MGGDDEECPLYFRLQAFEEQYDKETTKLEEQISDMKSNERTI